VLFDYIYFRTSKFLIPKDREETSYSGITIEYMNGFVRQDFNNTCKALILLTSCKLLKFNFPQN
jgi:hypothetical protein